MEMHSFVDNLLIKELYYKYKTYNIVSSERRCSFQSVISISGNGFDDVCFADDIKEEEIKRGHGFIWLLRLSLQHFHTEKTKQMTLLQGI